MLVNPLRTVALDRLVWWPIHWSINMNLKYKFSSKEEEHIKLLGAELMILSYEHPPLHLVSREDESSFFPIMEKPRW